MVRERVIIVGGPTASGKSDFAVKIAKYLGTDIISADSMQIYKDMNIGTAKVTESEMDGVIHHMLDVADPRCEFSVSDYVDMVRPIITRLNNEGKIPVIVGGTGLYMDALMYDFEFNNADIDREYREYLNNLAIKEGNQYIHDMLKDIDPIEAEKIHPNNVKRVIRALEIAKSGHIKSENKRSLHYDTLLFVLNPDRATLYDRIDRRVDIMCDNGLEEEIRGLLDAGLTFDMQSMQGIGYKEWRGYIDGDLTLDEVKELIKKNSRNYAKRQVTWFKNKYSDIANIVDKDDIDDAITIVNNFFNIHEE